MESQTLQIESRAHVSGIPRPSTGRFLLFRVIGVEGFLVFGVLAAVRTLAAVKGVRFDFLVGQLIHLFYHIFVHSALLPLSFGALMLHLHKMRRIYPLRGKLPPGAFRDIIRRSFLNGHNVFNMIRALLLIILFVPAPSHFKPMIPLFNSRVYDEYLLQFDLMLFGGHDIYVWFSQNRPQWLMKVMNVGYISLFIMFCVTFSMLFVQNRPLRLRWFLIAFLLAHTLAQITHVFFPTVGDVFMPERQYLYESISDKLMMREWMIGLMESRNQLLTSPGTWQTSPWNGIAAFPSLHVCQAYFFVYFAYRFHKWLLVPYLPLCILLTVSTVWLGVHYILDAVGGIGLGVLTLWIGKRLILWNERMLRTGRNRKPRPERHTPALPA